MTVRELMETAGFTAAALPDDQREITGVYMGDLLSWVMGRARTGDAWITIMSNQNIVAVATLTDVALIILAEDVRPDNGVAELAERKGINLYRSPEAAFPLSAKVAALL